MQGGGARGGCFSAVSRCIWGRPKEDLTRYRAAESDTIEFEDLITAENRASAARSKKQMVTEAEREMLRSGKFNELVEKQRKIDAEKDAELRRQEERLRREEEAYYTAKREAARRSTSTTLHVSLEADRQPRSQPDVVIHHQPPHTSHLTTSLSSQLPPVTQLLGSSLSQDEEDFDRFLESVKARQISITSSKETSTGVGGEGGVSGGSGEGGLGDGEEDEVDFGYWEKAELPVEGQPQTDTHTTTDSLPQGPQTDSGKGTPLPAALPRDMDLSLL